MNTIYQNLLNEAKKVSKNTYSPYSNFPVGSCVLFKSGKQYTGCNVENVSYGLTLCAERVAISKALSEGEKTKIQAIAIYAPKMSKCTPCGACRQWISEFGDVDTKVVMEDENQELFILSMEEILPYGFKLKDE